MSIFIPEDCEDVTGQRLERNEEKESLKKLQEEMTIKKL